jgi:hypothetical protein
MPAAERQLCAVGAGQTRVQGLESGWRQPRGSTAPVLRGYPSSSGRVWAVLGRARAHLACCRLSSLPTLLPGAAMALAAGDRSGAGCQRIAPAAPRPTPAIGVLGLFLPTQWLLAVTRSRSRRSRARPLWGGFQPSGSSMSALAPSRSGIGRRPSRRRYSGPFTMQFATAWMRRSRRRFGHVAPAR